MRALSEDTDYAKLLRAKLAIGQMMPPAQDEHIQVVCLAWQDRRVRGCVKDQCENCRRSIAISPSAQEMIAGHNGKCKLPCYVCAEKEMGMEALMLTARFPPVKGVKA